MVGISTIRNVYRFRKHLKNWPNAVFAFYVKKFPFEAIYRDGTKYYIKYLNHLWMASYGFKFEYGDDESIIFPYEGRTLRFLGTRNNGSIGDVFVEKELSVLDVKGRVVIDIGANIGDSTVYFVIMGAEKVIAIEPFPFTFDLLKKNITINGVQDKVKILNFAMGGKTEIIKISPAAKNTVGLRATEFPGGTPIKVITFETLTKDYNINNAVLKCDCEGCEYDLINNMSNNDFDKVDEVLIEYHNGLNSLDEILEKNGYVTKIVRKGKNMGLLIGKKK
ncbi:MAG: FkbM family methyltransferase [Thermoplasmatales archaeon]|nr:FkbM family methyltransferase [Thermoplasmatales archaeon]MCW6170407.1 FkbM family methyltransferase [Thermoplasmatales archaeon]